MGPDDDPAPNDRGLIEMDDQLPLEIEELPEELVEFVKPELHPGERLLWTEASKPRRSTAHRPTAIWALLLALGSLAISGGLFLAIFGPWRPLFVNQENILILGGLGSALTGIIALIVAGYGWANDQAERDAVPRMTYALSDRRAIIWSPIKGSAAVEIFTYSVGTLNKVHRLEYPDGSGDVYFDELMNDEDGSLHGPYGFQGIANV
jgi:hypothetical protein